MATEQAKRKHEAISYLKAYSIPKCIENLLNTVVNENPDDLFGYMADYFDGLAKPPSIANVTASETLSARGYASFQVEIEGLIRGTVQGLCSFAAPVDSKPPIETKAVKGKTPVPGSETKLKATVEDGQTPNTELNELDKIHVLINNINGEIQSALVGCKLYEQQEVDRILEGIIAKRVDNEIVTDENEKTPTSDESLPNDQPELKEDLSLPAVHLDTLSVSLAIACSAAYLQKRQLYQNLYLAINNKEPSSLCLPTPMMTLLSGGKGTSGKLYLIKDVMIYTKQDVAVLQALKQLTDIYQQLEMTIQQKTTGNIAAENGALTPSMDRPEQALDFIRDATAHDSDVSIALRLSTADIYDKEKQKYEICANTYKSSEELINVYSDLCERYPEIKILIDPLVPEDGEGWFKLNEKIGQNCFLINEWSFSNKPSLLKNVLSGKLVSGSVISVQDSSTVTQFLEQAKTIEGYPRILLVSAKELEGHEKVDMAVATQADFIIFGSPRRSEHIAQYNRLIAIERDMETSETLLKKQPLLPPFVGTVDEKTNEENAT